MRASLRWLWFNLVYFRQPPWDTRESPPELLEFMNGHPIGSALDLGCGTGTNLLTLASQGWHVTGIEYAWRAVQIARNRLKEAGLRGRILAGDVTSTRQIQDQYDLILDMGCYHGIPVNRRDVYRANVRRWLAPGGSLLLYAHYYSDRENSTGITREDIGAFEDLLRLCDQVDSTDSRGRSVVWMRFEQR